MSNYPKGLRFDIYERFTLSEDAPGISELEDIELIPRITMQTRDDQAVLSGDLLLSGTYVGTEQNDAVKELSHRIPVEITLPLKRIHRMDSIGIEIENFDVELLSARSLNITGVISLNGVSAPAEQTWNAQGEAEFQYEAAEARAAKTTEENEEDTAVSAASNRSLQHSDGGEAHEPNRAYPAVPYRTPNVTPQQEEQRSSSNGISSSPAQQRTNTRTVEDLQNSSSAQQQDEVSPPRAQAASTASAVDKRVDNEAEDIELAAPASHETQQLSEQEAKGREEQPSEPSELSESSEPSEPSQAATSEAPAASEEKAEADKERTASQLEELTEAQLEGEQEAASGERPNESQDDLDAAQTKEPKIAFASKHTESGEWSGSAEGVKSLLHKQAQEDARAADASEDGASDSQDEEERTIEESVKWKKLLLSTEQEELRFSKMKMCIVQKEETLESIASRYAINPKEIVLYNRLDTNEVEEGQVIYIPS